MKQDDNKWALQRIEIKFEKGYSFKEIEEEKHDRYIGRIEFKNKYNESFNLNIPPNISSEYMDLMRESIIKTAESLGSKIANSIKINKQ